MSNLQRLQFYFQSCYVPQAEELHHQLAYDQPIFGHQGLGEAEVLLLLVPQSLGPVLLRLLFILKQLSLPFHVRPFTL